MWYSPLLLWAFIVSVPLTADARTFSNSFLSFSLPDSWQCQQEGVAWVCSNKGPNQQNDAIIVMVAKVANPQDNLMNFRVFLSQPKTLATTSGGSIPSKVMYVQERVLAGAKWVQAQHLGSEVQNFYTLYVATVKESLAILVNFSAEKTKYGLYNRVFDQAMKTLKLTASQQLVFPKNTGAEGIAVFGITGEGRGGEEMLPPPEQRKSTTPFMVIVLGLTAMLAAAAYYLYKSKK